MSLKSKARHNRKRNSQLAQAPKGKGKITILAG